MKKPYIKKYGKISKFTVWIVDGNYIRENIDEEFTNFGQHYRFRFIPKNEFWIDKEYGIGREERFFIDHMLVENRLMGEGKSYNNALNKADMIERSERQKLKIIKKKEVLIKKVCRKLLKKYSKNNLKVYIVNGRLVRSIFFIDFTEGGHDKVYNFIPKNEIWIDDDVNPKERKFILLHEVHERNLISKGLKYQEAHKESSEIEYYYRHNPKKIDKILSGEIKNS